MLSYVISYIDDIGRLRRAAFRGDVETLLGWQSRHTSIIVLSISTRPATEQAKVDLDGRTLRVTA